MADNIQEEELHQERKRLVAERDRLAAGPARSRLETALAKVERSIRKRNLPLLGQVKVQAPCPESWDEMEGSDKERFCGLCEKNVHNLSAMTQLEAERFLSDTAESDVCITFYRRRDGNIMTSDCGPGVQKRAQQRRRSAWAGVSILAGTAAAACTSGGEATEEVSAFTKAAPPVETSDVTDDHSEWEMGEAPIVEPPPHHDTSPHQQTQDHSVHQDAPDAGAGDNIQRHPPRMVRGRRAPIRRVMGGRTLGNAS